MRDHLKKALEHFQPTPDVAGWRLEATRGRASSGASSIISLLLWSGGGASGDSKWASSGASSGASSIISLLLGISRPLEALGVAAFKIPN